MHFNEETFIMLQFLRGSRCSPSELCLNRSMDKAGLRMIPGGTNSSLRGPSKELFSFGAIEIHKGKYPENGAQGKGEAAEDRGYEARYVILLIPESEADPDKGEHVDNDYCHDSPGENLQNQLQINFESDPGDGLGSLHRFLNHYILKTYEEKPWECGQSKENIKDAQQAKVVPRLI